MSIASSLGDVHGDGASVLRMEHRMISLESVHEEDERVYKMIMRIKCNVNIKEYGSPLK